VIPPKSNGEFVAAMENVLATYEEPYNPACPVVAMDEQPFQLTREVRRPIPEARGKAKRVDYEYERAGVASIFVFTEPLVGWRQVSVRDRRTKVDWALEVANLLGTRYAKAHKVILVCDNLNTHTPGAFYEAFPPEEARELVKRIEFRYTPKHGSWLNVAENELGCMTSQCLKSERIGSVKELARNTAAWATQRNSGQKGVRWHFNIGKARVKLRALYPKFE
jgi:hypothetical protein